MCRHTKMVMISIARSTYTKCEKWVLAVRKSVIFGLLVLSWIPKTMSPQSFNLFRLICVFCERSSCHFGPSACPGRSALFFCSLHSSILVEPIRLIPSCYFQLSFGLLSSRKKRKCSNGWCRCLRLCLPLSLCVFLSLAAATFCTTPNNSHAQWCGNSEKSNETDKMTYFTEAWCRCRYSFYEWLSLSFFSFSVFVFRFHCTYMTEWL